VSFRRIFSILFSWGLLALAGVLQAAPEESVATDTRILIDISGSMKKNDPDNLRRPALRLLVGLLPAESRAGVWTFGQYVNMQVPLGKVDKTWRERARKGASKIHSRGLFTNIEDVLERATADWEGSPLKYYRHLVLMTDGVVDVSKDPAESAASRQRILQKLLPQLKQQEARVHTIALSERADHELMKTLSRETGGWYEQVDEADQLQRVFLRIFEKVGRPDTVPLKDNRFRVDGSITEATLLVFRSGEAKATRVVPPSGKPFGVDDVPPNVSWHRDEGYDLLTISDPEAGEWRIQAATDPDNRVVVVTDLKMHGTELPGRVVAGEKIPLAIHFSDHGKQIMKASFLNVVSLQGELSDADGPGEPRPILDDGKDGDEKAADGRFTLVVGDGLEAGRVTVTINAEGKTFQREQHQSFELVPPLAVEVERGVDGEQSAIRVRVIPDEGLLDPASMEFNSSLVPREQGDSRPVMLLPAADGKAWETRVDPSALVGSWSLSIHFSARTLTGSLIALDLDPVMIEGDAQPLPPDPPPAPPEPEPEPVPEKTAPEEAAVEDDRLLEIGLFSAGNLIALLLAGGGYWWVRRRRSGDQVQLVDDDDGKEAPDDGN